MHIRFTSWEDPPSPPPHPAPLPHTSLTQSTRTHNTHTHTQVKEIMAKLPEGRQTLMFSATLPRSLADFASAGLHNPQLIRLNIETKISPDLTLEFLTAR